MAFAIRTPRLPSPHRQPAGATLFRRLGGAVRTVIAAGVTLGVTLAGGLRRPAAPRSGSGHAAPRKAKARPAWLGRRSFPAGQDAPFTPQAYPGLSPEFCALLNTPGEDCDPELLRLLLAAVAHVIADALPPDSGIADAGSLFSTLWGRFAGLDPAAPEREALPDTQAAVPSPVADAACPARPEALPHPLPLPRPLPRPLPCRAGHEAAGRRARPALGRRLRQAPPRRRSYAARDSPARACSACACSG